MSGPSCVNRQTGTGFSAQTTISLGGVSADLLSVTATQLTCTVPAGSGTVDSAASALPPLPGSS